MLVFNRGTFTELWITIKAGEPLAILDTAYIEDYFGVDGQLTFRKMADDTRISFAMEEDLDATPSIAHDVFTGFVDLSILENGIYRVEGRVRDSLGNYRILSEVQTPLGTEDVTLFEIEITPLSIVVKISVEADLFLISGLEIDLGLVKKPEADVMFISREIYAELVQLPKLSADVYLTGKLDCNITLLPTLELDILNVYTKVVN